MIFKEFKKIKNRMLFWFLTLSMLPLMITLYFVYMHQTNELTQEAFRKLEAIRDLKVDRVESWLSERLGDLKAASGDYDLTDIEFIVNEEYKTERKETSEIYTKIRTVLNNYLDAFDDYEELFLLHPETGNVIISTKKYMEGTDKSDNEYFTEVIKSKNYYIKDVYYSKEINKNCMAFSHPVFCRMHKHKHLVGVLVSRVVLEGSLYELLLNRTGLGKTGETLIVNKNNIALNTLHWEKNSALNLKIKAEPAIRASQGQTGLIKANDYRGEEVLAAYTFIPEVNWGFVCKQDTRELRNPVINLLEILMLLLLISVIVIILSAMVLSKSISKPIVKLKRVSQEIEKGNYSIRIEHNSQDELGSLARSVNHMTKSIESNSKVLAGTTEISKAVIAKDDLVSFSTRLLQELLSITSSVMGAVYTLDEASESYIPMASIGANSQMLKPFNAINPEGEFGTAIDSGRIFLFDDIPEDTIFNFCTVSGNIKPRAILTIPVIVGKKTQALISLVKLSEFDEEYLDIVNQSWVLINQAYSNIISKEKMKALNENLNKANAELEKQKEDLQSQTEELHQQSEELNQSSLELQEQNIELEHQKEQLAQASKLKSEFLSNMSHELRTPLNSILALSEILQLNKDNRFSDKEVKHLGIIHKNGNLLLERINDVLNISKIEAGKVDVRIIPVSIKSVLRDCYDAIYPLADKKSIELKLDLPDELPLIETDPGKLIQVIQNLLSNAVKFTDRGHVRIYIIQEEQFVRLNIEDTGIGISEDKLDVIFDEFRQIDGSTTRQFEGSGLGLSIAKKLTMLLGGDIEVFSMVGEGSTFSIKLPLKYDRSSLHHNFMENTAIYEEPVDETDDCSKRKRLLVVEDNEAAIIQVQNALQRKGYYVDVARGGKEALEIVSKIKPDGIILDLMMPEMDGFEVLEKIRSTKETKTIPVLILTAKDLTSEDLSRLSANNVQQMVQKGSINLDGLYSKVKRMLSVKLDKEKLPINVENNPADKKTILLIEDNPDNMTTLEAVISDTYNTIEAYDGLEGLKAAVSKIPDLILLDINLPKIDGIELVGILKHSEDTKHIPVIAVTARATEADREELLGHGCDDYMAKPIDPKKLMNAIEKWLK